LKYMFFKRYASRPSRIAFAECLPESFKIEHAND